MSYGECLATCVAPFNRDCIDLLSYQCTPDSKVHGANMGPTRPRRAPCWPHELCYQGCFSCTFIFPCFPDLWYQTDPHWYSTERDWGDHVVWVAWEVTMDAGSVLEKDQGKIKWGPFQYKDHILTINFDPNWAFPDCNSSLNPPMATKWCKKLEVA